jgi:predicted alpha/beta superfamily hydrolase
MNHKHRITAGAIVVFSFLSVATAAGSNGPSDGEAVSCGIYRRIHSNLLQEDRTLLVRLPEDYQRSDKRYPVLYKLDGYKDVFLQTAATVQYLVDRIDRFPDHIVVAIENTDRNRDMFPDRGAGDFIRFLKEELTPFIDANYRTNGSRILCGQSLSSTFALYSFLREPDAFDGYVLSSFGLFSNWLQLFENELAKAPARRKQPAYLYVANAKVDSVDPEGIATKNGLVFLDSLRKSAASTLLIKYRVYEDEGHVPFPTIHDALKWMYGPDTAKRP